MSSNTNGKGKVSEQLPAWLTVVIMALGFTGAAVQAGRLEERINTLLQVVADHEQRIRDVEKRQ